MTDIHGPPKDIDLRIVTEDTEVDFSDTCRTGGELVLSYVDAWLGNFPNKVSASGVYTLSPGLSNSSPLEVHASSEASGQMDIRVYDRVRNRSVRYKLAARETGGVEVVVGKVLSAVDEADKGLPLNDGPEKASLLSQIAGLLLAIDTSERANSNE